MKTLLLAGTLLAVSGALPAYAAVTFCGPQSEGGTCEGATELKVFLEDNKDTTLGFGTVGGPSATTIMDLSSDGGMLNVELDLANGFATITPAHGFSTFNGIDVTIPGFTFTDLVFDVQLTPTASATDNFTISDFTGAHVADGVGMESDAANTDKEFSTTTTGTPFDEVNINSLTGFDEIKHIEVSGLAPTAAIPEPRTWVMLLTGFAMMAFFAVRRNGRQAVNH